MKNLLLSLHCIISICFIAQTAQAFPENVRQGYASCTSCHVSPTGGGVLTEYGQSTSEEFLTTWGKKGEASSFYGLKLPKTLLLGGDFRSATVYANNKNTTSQAFIPMQAELGIALLPLESLTLAANIGVYGGVAEPRQFYAMYKPHDSIYLRSGKFMRAYGLMNNEHTLLSRKYTRFNEGEESYNLEIGLLHELGEINFGATTKGPTLGEENVTRGANENGWNLRITSFLGDRSYLGINYLRAQGLIWDRSMYGLFFVYGISKTVYLESDLNIVERKSVITEDISTTQHKYSVTMTRFAWELIRGFHLQWNHETLDSIGDKQYMAKQRIYGPGIQWFPRPHFELQARIDKKLDQTYADQYGRRFMLIAHYYL